MHFNIPFKSSVNILNLCRFYVIIPAISSLYRKKEVNSIKAAGEGSWEEISASHRSECRKFTGAFSQHHHIWAQKQTRQDKEDLS